MPLLRKRRRADLARLYSDENYPFATVVELRRLGHDVLTAFESGRANQRIPDDQVLAFAAAERRAVLTQNRRHFVREHQRTPVHAGIVVCTVDGDFLALAGRVHDAVASAADLRGQLLRVNRPP